MLPVEKVLLLFKLKQVPNYIQIVRLLLCFSEVFLPGITIFGPCTSIFISKKAGEKDELVSHSLVFLVSHGRVSGSQTPIFAAFLAHFIKDTAVLRQFESVGKCFHISKCRFFTICLYLLIKSTTFRINAFSIETHLLISLNHLTSAII